MKVVSRSTQIFAESILPRIKLLKKNSIRDTFELVKYHSHVVTREREFCWKSNLQPQIAIVQITGYGLQITGYRRSLWWSAGCSQVLICGTKKTSVPSSIPIETESYLLPLPVNRLHSFCLSAVIWRSTARRRFSLTKSSRENVQPVAHKTRCHLAWYRKRDTAGSTDLQKDVNDPENKVPLSLFNCVDIPIW